KERIPKRRKPLIRRYKVTASSRSISDASPLTEGLRYCDPIRQSHFDSWTNEVLRDQSIIEDDRERRSCVLRELPGPNVPCRCVGQEQVTVEGSDGYHRPVLHRNIELYAARQIGSTG